MTDKLSAAIDVLLEKLEEQERSVLETKKMINSLLAMTGKEPRFQDAELQQSSKVLRPDIFYGKPLATAAREFLEWKGAPCEADEIYRGLVQGGFDFEWKEKDRFRNVAISLSKNAVVFHKLPSGVIGLTSWYPDVKKKKAEPEKTQNNTSGEEPEEVTEEKVNEANEEQI